MTNKNKMLAGVLVALVIVGGISFYGGTRYANAARSSLSRQGFIQMNGMQNGARIGSFRGMGSGMNGGFVGGAIIAKDEKSITVKLQSGGSKIILLSGSTGVTKTIDGSLSDLEIGKEVLVTGKANSDGSVTAQRLELRPLGSTTPLRN